MALTVRAPRPGGPIRTYKPTELYGPVENEKTKTFFLGCAFLAGVGIEKDPPPKFLNPHIAPDSPLPRLGGYITMVPNRATRVRDMDLSFSLSLALYPGDLLALYDTWVVPQYGGRVAPFLCRHPYEIHPRSRFDCWAICGRYRPHLALPLWGVGALPGCLFV